MASAYEKLATHFGKKEERIAGPTAREQAEVFVNNQVQLWQSLVNGLGQSESSLRNFYQRMSNQYIKESAYIRNNKKKDSVIILAKLPILDDSQIKEIHALNQDDAYLVAAAILAECKDVLQAEAVSNIMTTRMFIETIRYLQGGLLPQELSGNALRLSSQVEGVVKEAEVKLNNKIEGLDAFQKSLSEAIKTKNSSALWRSKGNWHKIGFIIWLLVFAIIVFSAGAFIILKTAEISAYLPKDIDGTIPYVSYLAFFIVPILGVAWLLRIISRFVTSQQTLADDARHREVMTSTYLALVADKDAKLDEKDRIIMLSAIFRPLPGFQTEDVAPPSILDILKSK